MAAAGRAVVGVDLAARYSAAVMIWDRFPFRGPSISTIGWADFGALDHPWTQGRHDAITEFAALVCHGLDTPTVNGWDITVLVEDVHLRAINPKPALRTQGALLQALGERGFLAQLILPTIWQKALGYKKTKGVTSKGWAKAESLHRGYVAPDQAKGKQVEDCRDAYLIAAYGWERE